LEVPPLDETSVLLLLNGIISSARFGLLAATRFRAKNDVATRDAPSLKKLKLRPLSKVM
jgi:hypothetical protein